MKQILRAAGVVSIVAGLAAGVHSVSAHHSTTMFDHAKTMTLVGTVVELRWVNPHVSLLINGVVKDREGDEPSHWLLEMTTAVKPGDKVIVEMSPLRDPDKQGGALKKVTNVATGQSFTANLRAQEMPGLE